MTCKICLSHTKTIEDAQLLKTYYACPHCEAFFLDEAFFLSHEQEQKMYSQHNNSLENEGYVAMFENFLDFFWQDIASSKAILDFGSGPTPVLSELMKRRGATVACYDKFYQPIAIHETQQYDCITSTEVFEHLDNPLETLDYLNKHLKEKGLLALMTLFHQNDENHFLTWWYRRDPTHIFFYTPKTIACMAEKSCFSVLKTDNKRVIILQKR